MEALEIGALRHSMVVFKLVFLQVILRLFMEYLRHDWKNGGYSSEPHMPALND